MALEAATAQRLDCCNTASRTLRYRIALLVLLPTAAALAPQPQPRSTPTKGNNGLAVDGAVDSSEFPGVALDVSAAFFRSESRLSRDVAVLAAAYATRRVDGRPRVVDACAGSGARSLRYARDLPRGCDVLANEPNDETRLRSNVEALASTTSTFDFASGDAAALLKRHARTFDVVDVDSFGLSGDVAAAVGAARDGGLVLATTTGAAAAGARGAAARAALKARLGCDAASTPAQNELGLRMLCGAVARAALAEGAALEPVVSLYAAHGPVFRVAAVVDRRPSPAAVARTAAFATSSLVFSPDGAATAAPAAPDAGGDVAGPVWTGPLQGRAALLAMRADAAGRGWLGDRGHGRALGRLLDVLVAEADAPDLDARLYASLDDVARRAGVATPGGRAMRAAVEALGYRAAPTHVDGKGLKTDAPMAALLAAARAATSRGT